MPVGAIIGAVGSVAGAAISAGGQESAANTAAQTAAANNALQQQIYEQNVGYATPFMQRGNEAGDELAGFLGLGNDPAASQAAFQTLSQLHRLSIRQDRGDERGDRRQGGAGLLGSGSTLKSLDAFGTGLAQQYGQAYVGNLENLNASGQAAQGSLAGIGENYANAVSSNNNNAASAAGERGDRQRQRLWRGAERPGQHLWDVSRLSSSFGGGSAGGGGGDGNAFGGGWIGG